MEVAVPAARRISTVPLAAAGSNFGALLLSSSTAWKITFKQGPERSRLGPGVSLVHNSPRIGWFHQGGKHPGQLVADRQPNGGEVKKGSGG